MANRDRSKERKRLKREKKRKEQAKRKQLGASLAGATGRARCYVTDEWIDGMAQILVLRDTVGGGYVFAGFLIDTWCLGLKDAFGRTGVTPSEFDEMVAHVDEEAPMVQVSLEDAREILAGAIRWAQEHQVLLPRHWERYVAVLGALSDEEIATADIDEYGDEEGQLHYVGREADLRKKLTVPLEEFMDRPGVVVEFVDAAWEAMEDEESFRTFREAITSTGSKLADRVRQWCFAKGHAPAKGLNEAAELFMTLSAKAALEQEVIDPIGTLKAELMSMAQGVDRESDGPGDVSKGVEQVMAFYLSDEGQAFIREMAEAPDEE